MSDRSDALAAENSRYDAMVAANVAALSDLCAPELIYVHSTGTKDDRQAYLDGFSRGTFRYERIEHVEDEVVILGDTALVWGTMRAEGIAYGKAVQVNSRVLAVWTRHDAAWRLVGVQSTRLPA